MRRVREDFIDRIKQSQAAALADPDNVKVTSKVATWLFLAVFLVMALAFLIMAIKSPPGGFKQSDPTEQTDEPAKEKPAAPIPSKNVPPPLKKQ